MTFPKRILGGTMAGMLASTVVHAALAGTLYYGLALRAPRAIVAELDLSMAPLVPMARHLRGGSGNKSPKAWAPLEKSPPPAPPATPVAETKEGVEKQEDQEAPCPEPCLKAGGGEGAYIAASQTFRKPRWIGNLITSRDYPLVAMREGKDGRVVLSVLIDAEGRVRDARLLQGSYGVLNEVALRKVREAVFSPAYDESNRPIPCKVRLPIKFELR